MLSDLIRVLKNVQENPVCEIVSGRWIRIDLYDHLTGACPLTQAAMKLGLPEEKLLEADDQRGLLVMDYLVNQTNVASVTLADFWMIYDRYENLSTAIEFLEARNE